jgi:hypothetical protein
VARFVIPHRVGFGLDDHATGLIPNQLAPDQFPRAGERIALEKLPCERFHEFGCDLFKAFRFAKPKLPRST